MTNNLISRGGQTAIAYSPTGRKFVNKRCKVIYTHVVLTKHKNLDNGDYGWFRWCRSLEEANQCKDVDI